MKHCSVIESDTTRVNDIGFLCWDGLPLDQLSVGLAYLKTANQLAPDKQLRVSILSLAGADVQSNCGVSLRTRRIDDHAARCGYLFLLGGPVLPPDQQNRLGRVARSQLRAGLVQGAVEAALIPLAHTGLLCGLDVAASSSVLSALQEQFPDISPASNDSHASGAIWSAGSGFSLLDLLSKTTSGTLTPQEQPRLNRKFQSYRPIFGRCIACAHDIARVDDGFTGDIVVDKAIELFRYNLEEPLQIKSIAEEVGISVRQLERKFVTATGLTPKAYYLEERLEKAQAIVRCTNLTLAEVALACGFGSNATLSQKYKQRFGQSPACERARLNAPRFET
ncbi:GlxA family transcriptional regulator [uncultured Ruegeria sp.]|uniref:GlxA family transcriptional regulator n=1 Tax=uncultured Ruegeria sp. TaxID=259304 RepID=UPI00261B64EB|nr:helix-turn-helix domain-containing protein [uncultured Ruegeria sp.]